MLVTSFSILYIKYLNVSYHIAEWGPKDGPMGNKRKIQREYMTSTSGSSGEMSPRPLDSDTETGHDVANAKKEKSKRDRKAEEELAAGSKTVDRIIPAKDSLSQSQKDEHRRTAFKSMLAEQELEVITREIM